MSFLEDMLGNLPELKRVADIVFILDATQAEFYKEHVLSKIDDYWDEFMRKYECHNKSLSTVRVSIVWFNDTGNRKYLFQKLEPTVFPESKDKVINYFEHLDNYKILDGRTAMEAIYETAESDWNRDGDIRRHIMVLIINHSDSIEPISLEQFYQDWHYKGTLGENEKDGWLSTRFKYLDPHGRRMILVAPCIYPYSEMEIECENLIRLDIDMHFEDLWTCISYST